MDIKGIVLQLTQKHGTNNPLSIAKDRGVLVHYCEMKNTLGYYVRYHRIQNIIIKSDLSEGMQRFVCAHELGHSILHTGINVPNLKAYTLFSTERIERQANTFAVELLLPNSILEEYRECSIQQVARAIGIPQRFIGYKAIGP
ncbi:ImmA/IrrE family metallo-endopeptidase [uncultured Mitsuokella sp.]|uniref:ImmA/IrrE family metallo-endopeptidase n=1 Tax=uncultured Mitsuokella sp. TaxID=453120 RepID=UPI00263A1AB2|nr:ImmA/IrrE family metallo-endopeptidase [uncultured Mitsuokella sp.]